MLSRQAVKARSKTELGFAAGSLSFALFSISDPLSFSFSIFAVTLAAGEDAAGAAQQAHAGLAQGRSPERDRERP
jgi:hypothetical protein